MTRSPGPVPRSQPHYDALWAATLVRWLEELVAGFDGIMEAKSEFVSFAGRTKKVTLVTDAAYTILKTDHIIDCNRAGVIGLTLPNTPRFGQVFVVADGSGGASGNTITINDSGSGITVNGTTSITITADYGRLDIYYNGTEYIAG